MVFPPASKVMMNIADEFLRAARFERLPGMRIVTDTVLNAREARI
jgi:hypothetical protein